MESLQAAKKTLLETRMGQFGVGACVVGGAVAASYLLLPGPKVLPPVIDPHKQSIDIGNGVRASPFLLETADRQPVKSVCAESTTLHQIFLCGLRKSRDSRCLGERTGPNRQYAYLTYQQVFDRACAFGSGLIQLGMKPMPDTFIGIYSMNRTEWVLAEQACNCYSMVTVALYDTLGPEASKHIINLIEIKTVVCDTSAKAKKLLDNAGYMRSLNTIIIMGDVTTCISTQAKKHGINIHSFPAVEALGKKHPTKPVPPKPSDLATVCFTSGTTGNPKGVMLTHGNFAAELAGFIYVQQKQRPLKSTDCHLSYLPLAHMFERTLHALMFYSGGHIGFFSGDVTLLFEDLQALRPTIFATVPRILNKIRDKVYSQVKASALKSYILDWAVSSKREEVKRGIIRRNSIWDRMLFYKVQAMFGGRVEFLVTGSAPLAPETLDFYKCALGCLVMEGYGQTEAVAGVCGQFPGDTTSGHVGSPFMCNFIKLVDVPEMNYYAEHDEGEICIYGPNVMQGYYKQLEATSEAIDKDGWLHSGDIGKWLPNGALKIIDRKKHIFKLSQGEYIAPEKIETVYTRSEFVAQVFVDGDSMKSRCMAVVVPDEEIIKLWATNNGLPTDMRAICRSEEVKNHILCDMLDLGTKAGFSNFEQVQDIHLHPDMFTLDNGLLTPTFKSKRPQLRSHFVNYFSELYKMNARLDKPTV